MKKHTGLLIVAIALLLVGAIGMAGVLDTSSLFPAAAPSGPVAATLGRQIYYTGADASGPVPRTIAGAGLMGFDMMGGVGCVDCHGPDGRGGRLATMMGTIDFADIRYSTLTTPQSGDGTATPAWTDADIARAIRDGVDPSGQPLKAPMPRWAMSDVDVQAVIAYLKELK